MNADRTYATTYVHRWHAEWSRRTDPHDVREGRLAALVGLIRSGRPAILHAAGGARTGYVDLLAAAALSRRGETVLLADATWQPGSRALDHRLGVSAALGCDGAPRRGLALSRAAIRRLDCPRLHYAVLSRRELVTFPATWGIDPARVHFTPFCATIAGPPAPAAGDGVLASGNSLRDYRALIEAAPRVGAELTLATSIPLPAVPGNVRAGFLDADEHERRMADAAVVVVPLLGDTPRSAGQQTYLNAMARAKPVVVTDAPGVRDYVTDGETGLIVANEPRALAGAINRLLADPALGRRLGEAARADVERRFTQRAYVDRLLALADRL